MGSKFRIAAVLLTAILFSYACSSNNNGGSDSAVDASLQNGNTLVWNATGKYLKIICSGSWTITRNFGSDAEWFIPEVSSGTGDKNVWLSSTQNTSPAVRNATITVNSGVNTVPLTLSQSSKVITTFDATIQGSHQASYDWKGNTFTVDIVTSQPTITWNISMTDGTANPVTWITPGQTSGSGNSPVSFTLANNGTRTTRPANIMVNFGSTSVTISIEQRSQRIELAKVVDATWFRDYPAGLFALEYSITKKQAKWVAWPLYASLTGSAPRDNNFWFDTSLNPYTPVYGGTGQPNDYRDQVDLTNPPSTVTYNRGHMCPSGDRTRDAAINHQTYCYANMVPQLAGLNSGAWGSLETLERNWASVPGDTLYICSGGTILNDSQIALYTTPSTMAVPKYFFKVVLRKNAAGQWDAIGFWFEHKNYTSTGGFAGNINSIVRTVREIEQLSGIDFYYDLPVNIQNQVETTYDKSKWAGLP